MTTKDKYGLHEKEIAKLLDIQTQAMFHQELIKMKMVKETDDD